MSLALQHGLYRLFKLLQLIRTFRSLTITTLPFGKNVFKAGHTIQQIRTFSLPLFRGGLFWRFGFRSLAAMKMPLFCEVGVKQLRTP